MRDLKRIVFLPVILFVLGLIVLGCIGYEEKAVKVLVNGSPIHGANGIIFDSKDRLHIASLFGGEIVVMDTKNGNIIDRMGSDQGVKGPDDLIFGPPTAHFILLTLLLVRWVGLRPMESIPASS